MPINTKETHIYMLLTSLVICGLASSVVTAPKIMHVGVNFPFSNVVFALLSYPILDCICELWGKAAARQAAWIGLGSQLVVTIIIQLSILAPFASFWQHQAEYQTILASGTKVVTASFIAFGLSQLLDIFVYQRIKELSHGKWLWLRSNLSSYVGQILDSGIFISIVFYDSPNKLSIFAGSIIVKMILSFLMTPVVYLIVMSVNYYLDEKTQAFKLLQTS